MDITLQMGIKFELCLVGRGRIRSKVMVAMQSAKLIG